MCQVNVGNFFIFFSNKDDVNKIPSDKILLWRDHMKEDYNFEIDEEKCPNIFFLVKTSSKVSINFRNWSLSFFVAHRMEYNFLWRKNI